MKKLISVLKLILLLIIMLAPAPLSLIAIPVGVSVAIAAFGFLWYAAWFIINCVYRSRRVKMITGTFAQSQYEYLEKKKDEVRADCELARKKVERNVRLSTLYGISLLVATALIAWGLGMTANHYMQFAPDLAENIGGRLLIFAALSGMVFAAFGIVPASTVMFAATGKRWPNEYGTVIERADYPLLYSVADRAAKAVGFEDKYFICMDIYDNGTSISEDGGIVYLHLSPTETSLMSESELYTVFLHEFSHATNRDTKWRTRFEKAKTKLGADGSHGYSGNKIKGILFAIPYTKVSESSDEYLRYASLLLEQRADDAVKAHGDAQEYINCTAKSMMISRYFAATRPAIDFFIFDNQSPITDFYERKRNLFEEALPGEYGRLKEVVLRTLHGKSDTHPTLSMRMKSLGVTDFDISARPEGQYLDEINKFIAACGKERATDTETWEETRKSDYLEVKERLEKFEQIIAAGNPDKYTLWESLYSYYYANPDRALELADKILESDPENPHANAIKGQILCGNDDARGLELLRKAAKNANAYIMMPLFLDYGNAVLRSGDEKLLEQLRAEQVEMAQKAMNCMIARYKLKKPTRKQIMPCDLSEDEISDMKQVIKNYGDDFSEIYIAKQQYAKAQAYVVIYQLKDPRKYEFDDSFPTYLRFLERGDKFFIPFHCANNGLAWAIQDKGIKLK